jgi:hypothetical protein
LTRLWGLQRKVARELGSRANMKPWVVGQMILFCSSPMSPPTIGFFSDALTSTVDRSATLWKARQGSNIGLVVDISNLRYNLWLPYVLPAAEQGSLNRRIKETVREKNRDQKESTPKIRLKSLFVSVRLRDSS